MKKGHKQDPSFDFVFESIENASSKAECLAILSCRTFTRTQLEVLRWKLDSFMGFESIVEVIDKLLSQVTVD